MEAPCSLPGPRRHRGAGHLARGLCLGALTVALLGPASAPAGAAAEPGGVRVVGPTGLVDVVEPDEMRPGAAGVVEGTCGLRGQAGETPQQNGCHGLPVLTALRSVGVTSFGFLTFPRPNGTTAYLPARDFEEPESVFEGGVPPIFFVDSMATRFYRPLLAGDPDDVNAEDNIATVSGEALTVGVHDGNVVTVQASASPTSTVAGSPVEFTATAAGGLPGESFSFDWTFGDGGSATGESISHAFGGSGTYEARVTAVGGDGSGGESSAVDIVVGDPPATAAPGAAATGEPQAQQPAGAPGRGGQGRGGKGSKSTSAGRAEPKAKGDGSSHTQTQADDSHRARPADRSSAPSPSAPPEPSAPPSPLPPPAVSEEAPAAETEGGRSTEAAGQTRPEAQAPQAAAGETVEGRLVADVLGPASLEETTEATGGQGSRSAPGALGEGGAGVPVGALIVVALLAGGALFEWRRSTQIR
jgi:PKD domain